MSTQAKLGKLTLYLETSIFPSTQVFLFLQRLLASSGTISTPMVSKTKAKKELKVPSSLYSTMRRPRLVLLCPIRLASTSLMDYAQAAITASLKFQVKNTL